MSVMYMQDVIFTCGHTAIRPVTMGQRHKQGSIYKSPDRCRGCEVFAQRDEYMRELEVRHAFNSECG